jgi:flagellar biosynthetic protein FliR
MELFPFDAPLFLGFLFALLRISIILFLMPFFGGQGLPAPAKAALCLTLTVALWPRLPNYGGHLPAHAFDLAMVIASEVLLGLILGLVARIIFAAIQMGGQLIGFQMGFTMVSAIDPESGAGEDVTAHFLYMTATLTFLAMNGHIVLLSGLMASFERLPPGSILLSAPLTSTLLGMVGDVFPVAIQIAAPVLAALFLVDLALAIISQASPQMNVMIIGFPIKISVGFFFLVFLLELMVLAMDHAVSTLPEALGHVLGLMR